MDTVDVAAPAVVCWGGVVVFLTRLTGEGRGPADLSLATWLTVFRGALAAGLLGFVQMAPPAGSTGGLYWGPALCVVAAGALDAVDGWLARRRNATSRLGKRLDVEADGVLVLSGVVVVEAWHLAPAWVLLVGFARYAYLLGIRLREYRGRPVGPSTSRVRNRLAYAVLLGALAVGLAPPTGPALARPLLSAVATGFLANFAYDWVTRPDVPADATAEMR